MDNGYIEVELHSGDAGGVYIPTYFIILWMST